MYLVVLGLVMVWYIPPFQKADEVVHFKNVATAVVGRSGMIQKRFLEYPEKLNTNTVAFRYDVKSNNRRVWEKFDDKELVSFSFFNSWNNYIDYFPVEIGVWLGSLTPYPAMSLYLGRLSGLILFLVCIWFSLKIIPKRYSGLIIAYSIIPMVIHQVTEVSYDVFLLCLAPLILSIFLRVLKSDVYWKLFLWLVVLSILFVLVKPGYNPVLLLIPIILWIKFRSLIISKPWIISIAMFLMIPVVLKFISYLSNNVSSVHDLVNGNYQLEIIKHDPIQILRIVSDTWEAKRDFYLKGMMGFFGWLDYEFDLYQYLIVIGTIVVFVASVIRRVKEPVIDWVGWLIIGGIIIGTYILIEMGFLMQWTVVGSTVVEGVQGRYLLPLLPLLLFWVSQFWLLVGKKRANVIMLSLVVIVLISGMVDKVYKRYYDLSDNFSNKDDIVKQVKDINDGVASATYVSSKEKFSRLIHTSDNDVVGGFELALNKKSEDLIKVPYRYSIKDSECKKELSWGYLDLNKINKEKIYLQKIGYLKPGFNDLCFEIEPIIVNNKEKYFEYVAIEGEPLVRFLYISSEVN
jgi:uncharacterized membrane protein